MNELKRALYKILVIGLAVIVLFSFWAVFADKLKPWGLRPDVMPFVVAYIAIFFGKEWGAGFGCFIGLLMDAACGKTAGFYTVTLMIFAIFIALLGEKYYRTHLFAGFFTGYALYLVINLLRLCLLALREKEAAFSVFFSYFLPAGLYSLLLSIPIYIFLSRIYRKLEE